MKNKKLFIAKIFDLLCLNNLMLLITNTLLRKRYIRVINYHDTPKDFHKIFESHLKFYKKNFTPISLENLENIIKNKLFDFDKPGLIITFDDGLKSNFDIADLIKKYNFKGIFFVPAGFVGLKDCDAKQFMKSNRISSFEDINTLENIAMTWDDLKKLENDHFIGCHTFSHHRMNIDDSSEILEHEIIASKNLLETKLKNEINAFCWVGGEENTYTNNAAKYIYNNYRLSFMTNTNPITTRTDPYQIQRTNIEANYPIHLLKFQLSGFMDFLYLGKRKRVEKVTSL